MTIQYDPNDEAGILRMEGLLAEQRARCRPTTRRLWSVEQVDGEWVDRTGLRCLARLGDTALVWFAQKRDRYYDTRYDDDYDPEDTHWTDVVLADTQGCIKHTVRYETHTVLALAATCLNVAVLMKDGGIHILNDRLVEVQVLRVDNVGPHMVWWRNTLVIASADNLVTTVDAETGVELVQYGPAPHPHHFGQTGLTSGPLAFAYVDSAGCLHMFDETGEISAQPGRQLGAFHSDRYADVTMNDTVASIQIEK